MNRERVHRECDFPYLTLTRYIMNVEKELIAALRRDISERLRPVCEGMSEESFQQLVSDIATVNLKYGVESKTSAAVRLQGDRLKSGSVGDDGGESTPT